MQTLSVAEEGQLNMVDLVGGITAWKAA